MLRAFFIPLCSVQNTHLQKVFFRFFKEQILFFLPAATLGAVGLGEGNTLCSSVRPCRLGQICGKMINVWFWADIWIFGQLMVILGKLSYNT